MGRHCPSGKAAMAEGGSLFTTENTPLTPPLRNSEGSESSVPG